MFSKKITHKIKFDIDELTQNDNDITNENMNNSDISDNDITKDKITENFDSIDSEKEIELKKSDVDNYYDKVRLTNCIYELLDNLSLYFNEYYPILQKEELYFDDYCYTFEIINNNLLFNIEFDKYHKLGIFYNRNINDDTFNYNFHYLKNVKKLKVHPKYDNLLVLDYSTCFSGKIASFSSLDTLNNNHLEIIFNLLIDIFNDLFLTLETEDFDIEADINFYDINKN